jgi:phospholipid-translocating ATPase
MEIMIISSESESGARTQIESGLDKINKARADPSLAPKDGFAVVIDGETLRFALDPSLKGLFLDFTTQCSAVVCCRVSPSQKALTVKLVSGD